MCRLDELGQVGPDVRDIWDGFKPTNSVTPYAMVEGHDTNQRRFMTTEPNKYLSALAEPRPGRNLKSAEQLWSRAGHLLVAGRPRLNTMRVAAILSSDMVLSNVWWSVRTENRCWDKVMTVWLNSSIGLLTFLSIRNTTEGGWVAMKKADLEELPVLDLRGLSEEQIQGLSDVFDRLADVEFERLPGMSDCAARRALDDGLSEILGLPKLDTLRVLLASEPVVSNRRL